MSGGAGRRPRPAGRRTARRSRPASRRPTGRRSRARLSGDVTTDRTEAGEVVEGDVAIGDLDAEPLLDTDDQAQDRGRVEAEIKEGRVAGDGGGAVEAQPPRQQVPQLGFDVRLLGLHVRLRGAGRRPDCRRPRIAGARGIPLGSAGVRALDAATARIPLDVRHRIAQLRVQARTPTGGLRRLPDLLVIGAQRCGTSSLYRYLGRHPDVTPSLRKEVEYFSRRFDRGERWYRAHFALANGRSRLAFEATPDYLFHPFAAQRAAGVVPGARLVVMLREPIARAWSHYHHMVALGHEPLDFDAAVAAEPDRCAPDLRRLADDPYHDPVALLRYSYVARGRYAEQLSRWREHFPADRMLVVRSEDFFADP